MTTPTTIGSHAGDPRTVPHRCGDAGAGAVRELGAGGATGGAGGAVDAEAGSDSGAVAVPHWVQKAALAGSATPHLKQKFALTPAPRVGRSSRR